MEQDGCWRRFLFSQRPVSDESEKIRATREAGPELWLEGQDLVKPRQSAPQLGPTVHYQSVRRASRYRRRLLGSASKPHYMEVCVALLKKISSVGDCRGPFFRGSFGDGGADLGTGTSATAAVGVRLERRTGGQGLAWLLGHATFSWRHSLWPYRNTPIWAGCNISGRRLLTRVQHADESRPNGTDSQARSGYQWLAGLRLLAAACRCQRRQAVRYPEEAPSVSQFVVT